MSPDGSSPLLLTVVLETHGQLDRESTTYRRLLAARLKWEDHYEIRTHDGELTTKDVKSIVESTTSKYIIFVRSDHQVSHNYMGTMLTHLRGRTLYLVDPVIYPGNIPKNVGATAINSEYQYNRDTDLYGPAFNRSRLQESLEAVSDLDRTAIYLSFRLYWTINEVIPLETGYSVASNVKSAIGLVLDPGCSRLMPLIQTPSITMRRHLLRYLVHVLRGIRDARSSSIRFRSLKDYADAFNLLPLITHVEPLQPFEAAWIKWIVDPTSNLALLKQLSDSDAYLEFRIGVISGENHFSNEENPRDVYRPVALYDIAFQDIRVTIRKRYIDRDRRLAQLGPEFYDFYARKITPSSTILFFDRPMQADDNAEYLYEYFRHQHPEFTNAFFALNPKSPDWDRLQASGFRLIPMFQADFYERFLESDLVVSSQIYNLNYKGKTLANSRFVYLQHGVQLNDMSDWVISKYFDVFVATGESEAEYLRTVAPVETLNSGLPRLETLVRNTKTARQLLFMPTWRFNLHHASAEGFANSAYFRAIDEIMNDSRLHEYLEATDSTLRVKLHPNVEVRSSQFRFSERVILSDRSYREDIASSEFVFSDYSSAVLDASFISTPVAYYQWDAVDFFRDQPYGTRLDYRDHGLGPVFDKHEALVDYIVGQQYKDEDVRYHQRRKDFFAGVETSQINQKITERMLSL